MEAPTRFQTAVQSVSRFFSKKNNREQPPRLLHPVRYPFGEFEFQLHAASGQVVELQTSRDFRNWEPLDTITLSKEVSVISDRKAGNFPSLFYRAVSGSFTSNYLGFISYDLPPGYSMISNPLQTERPQISHLFPSMPDETTLSKFNLVTFSMNKAVCQHQKWSHPSEILIPGEGGLILNPAEVPVTVRLVGEVSKTEQSIPIHTGTSMRASMLPLTGRLDTDLGFPIAPGDVVSLYSNHNEKYLEYKFAENGWEKEAPHLRLGEAFWVAKNVSGIWKQKLPESSPEKTAPKIESGK